MAELMWAVSVPIVVAVFMLQVLAARPPRGGWGPNLRRLRGAIMFEVRWLWRVARASESHKQGRGHA